MDLMSTVINAAAATVVGVLVTFVLSSQLRDLKVSIKDIRKEVGDDRADVKADIGEVKQDVRDMRGEMNERFRDQGREIAALRSDVTQLALALGSRPQPQAG